MKYEIVSKKEDWNPEIFDENPHFTQSFEYGLWQEGIGKKVLRLKFIDDNIIVGFAQFVEICILKNKKAIYCPNGPVFHKEKFNKIEFKKILEMLAKKSKYAFVRIDDFYNFFVLDKTFSQSGTYSWQGSSFQPKFEFIKKIEGDAKFLLSSMHKKTQYSVGYPTKKGVENKIISVFEERFFGIFLNLLKETASRNNFNLHSDEYYRSSIKTSLESGKGFLTLSFLGDIPLSGIFIFIYGKTGHFVFGGSSDSMKNLCAPYGGHFESMLEAKKRGASYYNFGGVSDPKGVVYKSLKQLSVFKEKFSGERVFRGESFDFAKGFWYFVWVFQKRIRIFFNNL